MASTNTRAKLIGTAIKVETTVKEEDKVKTEPVVNTRRANRSWPTSARLVHLDRTPRSEECIANDHFSKFPDFPEHTDSSNRPSVTPSNTDHLPGNTSVACEATLTCEPMNSSPNGGNCDIVPNVTPNKNPCQGSAGQSDGSRVPQHTGASTAIRGTGPRLDTRHDIDNVTPANADESMDDGGALLDLESKQAEPESNVTAEIDLPEDVTDEVTLPEVNTDLGNDLLTSDFLDTEVDNSTILGK